MRLTSRARRLGEASTCGVGARRVEVEPSVRVEVRREVEPVVREEVRVVRFEVAILFPFLPTVGRLV